MGTEEQGLKSYINFLQTPTKVLLKLNKILNQLSIGAAQTTECENSTNIQAKMDSRSIQIYT